MFYFKKESEEWGLTHSVTMDIHIEASFRLCYQVFEWFLFWLPNSAFFLQESKLRVL